MCGFKVPCRSICALLDQLAKDTRRLGSTDPPEAVTELRVSFILDGAVGSPLTAWCLPVPGYSMRRVCLHLPQLMCLLAASKICCTLSIP